MARTTELDIKLAGLGHIIASSRHAVPIYQRSYAWKDGHVEDLLNDISTAIHDGEEEYFLGSIVLTNADSDQPDVVDVSWFTGNWNSQQLDLASLGTHPA